ncbi:MAG: N-6 DNA methylase, partial [Ignavibacteriaceae bacterium]|nr:N-6 DNA methylase [Ignavibacteriaceae bacterium]
MSEELQTKYLKNGKITGQKFGKFEYFQIGATTFKQLATAKIVPAPVNKKFNSYKPDRLIVDRSGTRPVVIVVIEDKSKGKFNNENEVRDAIRQCNNYCQEIGSRIGIITDGATTFWINPGQKDDNNNYFDESINKERSFSFIKKIDGLVLNSNFNISEKEDISDPDQMGDETRKIYQLLLQLLQIINDKNSIIKEPERIDPLPLAKRVWQDIWVATGKSPEKCLYNVAELFIYKFLSDLKLLQEPENFEFLISMMGKRSNKDVLSHYAKTCRPKIKELFPKSWEDGTTIIDGTIFVNEDGEANSSQSLLFVNSLKKFKEFESEQGTFEHIDKDFKTKIFETFFKQSVGQKALGQYFTPRKVVQAVVKMSGIENLKKGARFCDPFCGVGGFVLEAINLYRINDFEPIEGEIKPPITYFGFDKGFEKDDERTIILAKANMLIYLTEIISKNPNLSQKFAGLFNNVFKLWQSNLGTLEKIFEKEEERFDLIMTNPPYVTSGSSTIKNEISDNSDLDNFYSINATGIEGLALEWIIKNLKKGGKAFVIIPEGILNRSNDTKLRKFILESCFLEAIISLPGKTFFSTPKKTYILVLTRKQNIQDKQDFPVFTYLVSKIGETLDVKRFETDENDLDEAVKLFRIFQVTKKERNVAQDLSKNKRCKIQQFDLFAPEQHWSVDRWWTKDEKIELGIEEEAQLITVTDFLDLIDETITELSNISKKRTAILNKKVQKNDEIRYKTVSLSDRTYFNLAIGRRLLKKDLFYGKGNNRATIPAFSANVFKPFGYVEKSNISEFNNPFILWGIDGEFELSYKPKGEIFAATDHCGTIEVLDENLNPEFILLSLKLVKYQYGFDRGLRANLKNVGNVSIDIPVNEKDDFDLETQKYLVDSEKEISTIQN